MNRQKTTAELLSELAQLLSNQPEERRTLAINLTSVETANLDIETAGLDIETAGLDIETGLVRKRSANGFCSQKGRF